MNNLEKYVLSFCQMENSEEFKKAERLVKEKNKIFEIIKTEFKKMKKTEMTVSDDDKEYTLSFSISKYERIDTSKIPFEDRINYLSQTEIWKKVLKVEDKK